MALRFKIPFRRIITGKNYIPEIDGLRFAAILSVILFHAFMVFSASSRMTIADSWITNALFHGKRGVPLFFVISGFVLSLPYADHYLTGRPHPDLRRYFLRRITRLEPPYMINLLVCFVLLILVNHQSGLLPHLAANIAYLHTLIFATPSPINSVAWSLEVEIQFYCIMPILAMLFRLQSTVKRRMLLVIIMLTAGILQILFLRTLRLPLLYSIQFFLAGFLLADLYLADRHRPPRSSWTWDALSLAGWPLVFAVPDSIVPIAMPFLILILYVATFRGVAFRWFFTRPAITISGGMCYSIYLFHQQIISLVSKITAHVHNETTFWRFFVPRFFLSIILIALFCGAYYLLIERPCMDPAWPRKLLEALRRSKAVPSKRALVLPQEGQ